MTELGPGVIVAAALLIGTVSLVVLWKFPEVFVALLLCGQDFVQAAFRMVGMTVERRTFALAGSFFFGAAVLLLAMNRLMKKRTGHKLGTHEHWWIIGMVLTMGLFLWGGLTYTQTPWWGTRLVVDYLTFGVGPFVLCFVFIKDLKGARRLMMWVFLFVAAYMALMSIHSMMTQHTLLGSYGLETNQTFLEVELRGSQELQDRSTILLAALLGWYAMTDKKWAKWVLAVVVPIIIAYVIMSGARTGLLIIGTFGFVIPVLLFRGKLLPIIGVSLATILLMLIALWVLPEESTARITGPLVGEDMNTGQSGKWRLEAWGTCIDMFKESPVLGAGTGGFAMAMASVDEENYPHNMFLQMFAENGIFAGVALCVFWFVVFYFPYRHLQLHHRGEVVFGLMVWVLLLMTNEFYKGMLHNAGVAHNQSKIIFASGIVARVLMLSAQEEREAKPQVGQLEVPLVGPAMGRLRERRV